MESIEKMIHLGQPFAYEVPEMSHLSLHYKMCQPWKVISELHYYCSTDECIQALLHKNKLHA